MGLNPASIPEFNPEGIPIRIAPIKAKRNPVSPRKSVSPKDDKKSGFPAMLINEFTVSPGPGRICLELNDLDSHSHPIIRSTMTHRLIIRFLTDEFFIG
jgi:hypothetical protein